MEAVEYKSYFVECDMCKMKGYVDYLHMANFGYENPIDYFKDIGWEDCEKIEGNPTLCPDCAGFVARIKSKK